MGLFSSSSSKKQTTNNSSAAQSQSGLAISGNDSTVTVNELETDFGAVEGSFGLAEQAIAGVERLGIDGFDLAENLGLNAQNQSFGLAGASLAANAQLSNELLRRDQIVTASIIDTLGETKAGFDEVSASLNQNAAATGEQLAGIASGFGGSTKTILAVIGVIGVGLLLVKAK